MRRRFTFYFTLIAALREAIAGAASVAAQA